MTQGYVVIAKLMLSSSIRYVSRFGLMHFKRLSLHTGDRLATGTRSDGHLREVLEYDVVVLVEVEQRDGCQ